MAQGKNNQKHKYLRFFFLGLFFVSTPALIAYAAVSFSRPVPGGTPINSPYGPRTLGGGADIHKGVDYGTPRGTNISLENGSTKPKSVSCAFDKGGYGSYAIAQYDCNVEVHYGHLLECNSKNRTARTGGAKGEKDANGNLISGSSTGAHLHLTIKLGNARIDAEEYFNRGSPDLCNEDVRKSLIDDANAKAKNTAGKDGTQAPIKDGGQSTHVDPKDNNGSGTVVIDGKTYQTPRSGGYTVVEDEDGRIIIVPDNSYEGDDSGVLDPGDPANLTPEGEVEHDVTGCATDTWKAMVNQSVMQARREMMFNQRYIAKGDSMMAYSCLDTAMDRVREDLGPVFSETKRWVNVEVDIIGETVTLNKELGETSLDGALVNAAYDPYERWIGSNFNHDFLGGLMEHSAETGDDHGHDQSYSPCSTMQDVWKAAKCMNMTDDPMFPTFQQMIDKDPRNYPHGTSCHNSGITQEMIDIAKGKEVKFDKVQTYLNMLYPDATGKCHPPIRTGVTVVRMQAEGKTESSCPPHIPGCETDNDNERISKEKTYDDGLCITVGCSYQNSGGGAGECVVK